jgi:hypothetical protein
VEGEEGMTMGFDRVTLCPREGSLASRLDVTTTSFMREGYFEGVSFGESFCMLHPPVWFWEGVPGRSFLDGGE